MEKVKKILVNAKIDLQLQQWWAEDHFPDQVDMIKQEINEIDEALSILFDNSI